MAVQEEIDRTGVHAAVYRRLGRAGDVVYLLLFASLILSVQGLLAWRLSAPLLFVSLGPTVFLAAERPLSQTATPRNQVLGHGAALLIGWGATAAFGFLDRGTILEEGVTPPRVLLVAFSLGATFAALQVLKAEHAPAASTNLMFTLGFITEPSPAAGVGGGVALLAVSTWVLNRALRAPTGVWSAGRPRAGGGDGAAGRSDPGLSPPRP